MNSHYDHDKSASDAPASSKTSRKKIWRIGNPIIVLLLIISCGVLVQLVLTGIIAEPETLINQIGEFLFGSP